MEFKPTYTKKEVKELVDWFENNEYPHSINLGGRIKIDDMAKTVKQLSHLALTQHDNRNSCGPIAMLFQIREKIQSTLTQ